jgi:hypothetical protein
VWKDGIYFDHVVCGGALISEARRAPAEDVQGAPDGIGDTFSQMIVQNTEKPVWLAFGPFCNSVDAASTESHRKQVAAERLALPGLERSKSRPATATYQSPAPTRGNNFLSGGHADVRPIWTMAGNSLKSHTITASQPITTSTNPP